MKWYQTCQQTKKSNNCRRWIPEKRIGDNNCTFSVALLWVWRKIWGVAKEGCENGGQKWMSYAKMIFASVGTRWYVQIWRNNRNHQCARIIPNFYTLFDWPLASNRFHLSALTHPLFTFFAQFSFLPPYRSFFHFCFHHSFSVLLDLFQMTCQKLGRGCVTSAENVICPSSAKVLYLRRSRFIPFVQKWIDASFEEVKNMYIYLPYR